MELIASEPLADARSHPQQANSSIDLLVDELIGVEAKPSAETDPILDIFQELQTKIRDLEERDRKRDKEVKNLHHKLLGLKDENTELRRRLDGIESRQKTYSDENTELRRRLDGIESRQKTYKDENAKLRKQLNNIESWQQTYSEEIAYDKRRIAALEKHQNTTEPQPKQKDRGDILRALLAATPHGKMLISEARSKMGLSKSQFSDLLKTLRDHICFEPYHHDRRKKVLILKNKNQ
ncbi:MAG: hypothetical protein PHX61_13905 [Alphaproteobacteria bacterium]|nr:hypothetical protein [Alphaproteobacteria bacterium]